MEFKCYDVKGDALEILSFQSDKKGINANVCQEQPDLTLVCLWQAPGALHHVIGRDIDGIKLFRNRKDREDFLERLADLCKADALVRIWRALLL